MAPLLVLLIVAALFHLVYRPWQATWGATDEEIRRAMVGDEIVEHPNFNATRAVGIEAGPEEIWPWIVQIGYGRAGFYSYDRLDNDGVPSAERILPEYQELTVGDRVPLTDHDYVTVAALGADSHLLLVFEGEIPATWAWGLYPTESGQTRLVTRLRIRHKSYWTRLFYDAFEIIMMRKCLLGIKRRAEER